MNTCIMLACVCEGLTIISWSLKVEVCVSFTLSLATSVSDLCMCSALCPDTNTVVHSLKGSLIEMLNHTLCLLQPRTWFTI